MAAEPHQVTVECTNAVLEIVIRSFTRLHFFHDMPCHRDVFINGSSLVAVAIKELACQTPAFSSHLQLQVSIVYSTPPKVYNSLKLNVLAIPTTWVGDCLNSAESAFSPCTLRPVILKDYSCCNHNYLQPVQPRKLNFASAFSCIRAATNAASGKIKMKNIKKK
ncbi:hypothetical protein IF1G_03187 [Cordyceps javanica]|uniref:Uncharacterized protein n=1 Tax=Cordyceps javanica TaxID=43265 RepID=A0A545W5W4_9HYPO|nr:hypothetical protein IF1G_03187 [Cordyceps javanica]TQW09371.1 hypothetical protein IF2G_03802 [Cordyceps javanica]